MIDIPDVMAKHELITTTALQMLEDKLESDEDSCDDLYWNAHEQTFRLTYSYEPACECCSYGYGGVEVTLDEVQEALNATQNMA